MVGIILSIVGLILMFFIIRFVYAKWKNTKLAIATTDQELIQLVDALSVEYTKIFSDQIPEDETKEYRAIFILYYDMNLLCKSLIDWNAERPFVHPTAIREDIVSVARHLLTDDSKLLRIPREKLYESINNIADTVANDMSNPRIRTSYAMNEFRKLFYRCAPLIAPNEAMQEQVDFEWLGKMDKCYGKAIMANYEKVAWYNYKDPEGLDRLKKRLDKEEKMRKHNTSKGVPHVNDYKKMY